MAASADWEKVVTRTFGTLFINHGERCIEWRPNIENGGSDRNAGTPGLPIPSYADLLKQKTMQKLFSQSSHFVSMDDLSISSSRTPHNSGNTSSEADAGIVDDFLMSLQQDRSKENGSNSTDDDFVKRSLTVKSSPPGYGFCLQGGAPVFVSEVHQGSAADLAGLRRGDFIVKINGHPIIAKTHSYVVDIVRYSAGAPITFTLLSPSLSNDSFTNHELRVRWAKLHLLNFPGSSSALLATSPTWSSSPSASPLQSPTQNSQSLRNTPTPPAVRPRTSSLGTVDSAKRGQFRSQSFSITSGHPVGGGSPLAGDEARSVKRHETFVESDLEKKRRLLMKGTLNIFASPPKQNPASPEKSTPSPKMSERVRSASKPQNAVRSDSPNSTAHIVNSGEKPQAASYSAKQVHDSSVLAEEERVESCGHSVSSTALQTPVSERSSHSARDTAHSRSLSQSSKISSPMANGRGTPTQNPPTSDAALQAVKSILDIALPNHLKRRTVSTVSTPSVSEMGSSPQDVLETPPRPPQRSSSYKRLNEIIADQESGLGFLPQTAFATYEQKPAWQWNKDDVQGWLTRNGFHQSAKMMTELEGLQLLSLKRKEMLELGLRDEAVMERLFNAIGNLRRGLSLQPVAYDQSTPSTPRGLSPSLSKGKFDSPTTPTRGHIVQPVREWRMADVDVWLRQFGDINHALCAGVFTDHAVTGRTLLRLTDEKLISMGVSAKPLRQDILSEVQMLRMKQEELELRKLLMERRGPQPVN